MASLTYEEQKASLINKITQWVIENTEGLITASKMNTIMSDITDIIDTVYTNQSVRPVISMVNELPESNNVVGDRYFVILGHNSNNIAEWTGASWSFRTMKTDDVFYSKNEKRFVLILPNGRYELSEGKDYFEMDFSGTTSVTAEHNLNRYPSVVAMDSSNRQLIVSVDYINRNKCYVSWNGETSGRVICN